MALSDQILNHLRTHPGLTDREITDALMGRESPQQHVNQVCRQLDGRGLLVRRHRSDGKIGNYPPSALSGAQDTKTLPPPPPSASPTPVATSRPAPVAGDADPLAEDSLKKVLEGWLTKQGWQVKVAWGKEPGADIIAWKPCKHWIIEVKGRGSLSAMRVNYFLGILGETLQRMDDPEADYSIALPDLQQFRNLWQRLPDLAKRRTRISMLFVDQFGHVFHDDRLAKEAP